jgi:3-hydroxyacyl-CoA dehydrogenase
MYIYKAAVIGAGAMGAGIAQVITYAGLPVILKDVNQEAVDRGLAAVRKIYQGRVEKGKMTAGEMEAKLALVSGATDYSGFGDVDIVIEAVFEDLSVKRALIRELEAACPASTILASNTSSLAISAMAEAAQRPEKIIGMHFFNPAPVMKLVEVIAGSATSAETLDDVTTFTEGLRKIPIRVRECAGFLVNRLLMPYLNEAAIALQEGAADARTMDAAMVAFGLPMGPFTLMDIIGLDVCVHVGKILHNAYGARVAPAAIIERLHRAGRLGTKSGAGFYNYDGREDAVVATCIADIQKETGKKGTPFSEARLILPMLNEAALSREEEIATAGDIDVAMMAGIGFPQERGGPLHHADRIGLDALVSQLSSLATTLGPRFTPAPLLRRMVADGHLGEAVGQGFFKSVVKRAATAEAPLPELQVDVQVEESVATITLDHPPANLLTLALLSQLDAAMDRLRADDAVKAILITGAGTSFAAGADIRVIAAIASAAEGERLARQGQALFDKIEQMPIPVIAAITGFCLGGGLELALACHLRVAGDRAKLGLPEMGLGIMPGFGGTQRLTRRVGQARAMEFILTGEMMTAAEAKEIGLVNRVVPEAEVLKQAQGLAKKIASKGKVALAHAMQAISHAGRGGDFSDGLSLEAHLFGKLCDTADKKEGITAFLSKRLPKFVDR